MNSVRDLLARYRLDAYAESFERHGYNDAEYLLCRARDHPEQLRQELTATNAVAMKRGHASKLIDYAQLDASAWKERLPARG